MIKFDLISIQNFMSVGNITQQISFRQNGLTLIVGENIDLGVNGSSNGVGKTTVINALSFVLYGSPLVSIKKDNLINDKNLKNMLVSLTYSVRGKSYKIERGRKPNFLRFFVNDNIFTSPEIDEALGENRWTQAEIEKTIDGMSHNLFKQIVALHTKTIPFLQQKDSQQREIIEELLGIAQLSRKADQLKEQNKQVKDDIRSEEIRVKTIIDSNDKIQKHINDLRFKSQVWEREHDKKILKFLESIELLNEIDIEQEIASHRIFEIWNPLLNRCFVIEKDLIRIDKLKQRNVVELDNLENELTALAERNCPTCGQMLHNQQFLIIQNTLDNQKKRLQIESETFQTEISLLNVELEDRVNELSTIGEEPTRRYKTLEDALNHRHTLAKVYADITREQQIENPYIDQIANLSSSGLQDVNYDHINNLSKLKNHQDFLFKLLTSKESFIRKKIIDQNLNFLNKQLNHYLIILQLPHEASFQSDLSVSIEKLGREYDFDQLSNGESNRLILSLSWAFRDTWESMNDNINLLVIDEVIDSGLDAQGTDASLEILKNMTCEKNKNIFLISHKNDLESRMDNILLVQKRDDFTVFSDVNE